MERQTQAGKKRTPVVQNARTEPRSKKKAGAKQPASSKASPTCTAEERYRLISEEAYFLAQQRGFQGNAALDDWLQAEAEVDARLVLSE